MEYKPRLTKKEEEYKDEVQSELAYCSYCQSYDGGEIYWILGRKMSLDELLDDFSVPEKSWDKIIANLHCLNCGNESFDRYDDIGVKTEYDKAVERHWVDASELHGKEVSKFEEFIVKYPLLAYSHKFGKKIYKELKEKKLPIVKAKGKFFRAKRVKDSNVESPDRMFNPPVGKSEEGRFNHAGQSHLYLSNDKETAIKEIIRDKNSAVVWCQEFEIFDDIDNILDLSFDWQELTLSSSALLASLTIYDTIRRSDRNRELYRPDYYLTRFIMDCAKALGYNGIKYDSAKNISEYNLVLFYRDKIDIKVVGEPKIEIFLNKQDRKNIEDNILDIK